MGDIFRDVESLPDTLVTCWFGFTTVELWGLSKITRDKVNKETSEDNTNEY